MIDALDLAAERWLHVLADWSLRWGAMLFVLWVWFAVRAPRSAAVRYLLLYVTLAIGLATPLVPRWGPGIISTSSTSPLPVEPSPPHAAGDGTPSPPPVPEVQPGFRQTSAEHLPSNQQPSKTPTPALSPEPPPQAPTDWIVIVRRTLFAMWVFGALVLFARFAAGCAVLSRLRRQSLPSAPESHRLLEQMRTQFGLVRRTTLATHPGVHSPLLIGGLKPAILVPPNWDELPQSSRRSCLLHELVHVARYDDWIRALLELARAVFFFHPLVHWLAARCRYEQELLCDDAVLSRGIDRNDYARTLLDFSRRLSGHRALRWTGQTLPFLSRATTRDRVRRLLEGTMLAQSVCSRRRLAFIGVAAAVVAWSAVGLRVKAVEPPDQSERPEEPPQASAAAHPGAGIVFKGSVADPDGRPLQGASVRLYRTGFQPMSEDLVQQVTTDPEGRFQLEPISPAGDTYKVAVRLKGFASYVYGPWAHTQGLDLKVTMEPPVSLRGRVIGPDGEPVSGAEVYWPSWQAPVREIHSATTDANGLYVIDDLAAWKAESVVSGGLAGGYEADSGEMSGSGFAGGGMALRVEHPDFGRTWVIVPRVPDTVNVRFRPPAVIIGRVLDRASGEPLAGVLVNAQFPNSFTQERTDEEGRFRLLVQPPGEGVVWIDKQRFADKAGWSSPQFTAIPGGTITLPDARVALAPPQPAERDPSGARDAEQLNEATARAIRFLRNAQNADGSWPGADRWQLGVTSLAALTLLKSGVPADDPALKSALDWLAAAQPPSMVYEISLQTVAFCAADPKRYAPLIRRNVQLLEQAQIARGEGRGGWSYSVERGGFLDLGGDRSNSEFAVWALDEAVRAGARATAATWRNTYGYWRDGQNADGSWGYTGRPPNQSPGTGSMTTSGIASIAIAARHLAETDKEFVPDHTPLARAWDWMARHFTVRHNPASSNWLMCYLMTLRRAADLTGKEMIGTHQWYREGREFLLQAQDAATGAWKGTGSIESNPIVATCMALLFLNPEPRFSSEE